MRNGSRHVSRPQTQEENGFLKFVRNATLNPGRGKDDEIIHKTQGRTRFVRTAKNQDNELRLIDYNQFVVLIFATKEKRFAPKLSATTVRAVF